MLAKENYNFMKYWDKAINPNVDLETLTTGSETEILYKDMYGFIKKSVVRRLCCKKEESINTKFLAMNNSVFMSYWDPKLNPNVKLETLKTNSNHGVRIVDEYGILRTIRISSLCRRKITKQQKSERLKLVKDIPEIMELYIPELNTDVNLSHLTVYSNTTITIKDKYGKIRKENIMKLWASIKGRKLAIKYPNFIKVWNKNLNPNINIETITANSTEYINLIENGKIVKKTVKSICNNQGIKNKDNLAINNEMFNKWVNKEDNLDINLDILPCTSHKCVNIRNEFGDLHKVAVREICKYKTTLDERKDKLIYAKNNEIFMSFWNSNLNPDVDLEQLLAQSHNNIKIYDQFNNIKSVEVRTICTKYINKRNDLVDEQLKLKNTILQYDSDFFEYLDENEYKISYCNNSNKKIKFACPCCGYKWSAKIKTVAFRNPKCPICKDQGIYENEIEYKPSQVYFRGLTEDEYGTT